MARRQLAGGAAERVLFGTAADGRDLRAIEEMARPLICLFGMAKC
jgi:hypothetical protein